MSTHSPPLDSCSMKRILVLGDGDFSFSSTLISTLSKLPYFHTFSFLITSFDASEVLISKYTETNAILRSFAKLNNVSVKHGVDATVSMKELLQFAHVADFTDIIFNFPHLGTENSKLHSSLLSHFMHHARQVVSPTGIVYISLAFAQAERWDLEKAATTAGFSSFDTVPFDLYNSWGSTYNIKRHHNGQSFVRRIGDCACFCWKRSDGKISPDTSALLQLPDARNPSVFRLGLLLIAATATAAAATAAEAAEAAEAAAVMAVAVSESVDGKDTTCSTADSSISNCGSGGGISISISNGSSSDIERSSKKRARKESKKHGGDDAFGFVRREINSGGSTVGDVNGICAAVPTVVFECGGCGKQFPLEQGVRSHIHLVHTLGRGAPSAEPLPCPHCDRMFRQQASLDDHLLAKHTGAFVDTKPAWAANTASETSALSATATATAADGCSLLPQTEREPHHSQCFVCPICPMQFDSSEDLELHVTGGVNPNLLCSPSGSNSGSGSGITAAATAATALHCSKCGRLCKDHRSLQQHFNFCASYPTGITTTR